MNALWSLLIALGSLGFAYSSKVPSHPYVHCGEDAMEIYVWKDPGVSSVELDKWGKIPGCESTERPNYFSLSVPYDHHKVHCGITKVRNIRTGDTIYYHQLGVVMGSERHILRVKCSKGMDNSTSSNLVKRDVLPPEFEEPDYIEITSEISGRAPVPILGVGVRQNGNLVDGEINVVPGTPLSMEVFLDDDSASTYGILVSYMEVTDTNDKKETIVFNGCSLDSYLFENFVTESGDYLAAKFRAFKFPESNYVLFQGTVDVCLDKCKGIQCSNGQVGFGRKRRSVIGGPADPNKIFEVTMETYIKFEQVPAKPDIVIKPKYQERPRSVFEDFYIRESERFQESELLEREPPSIVFTSEASGLIISSYLCLLLAVFLVRV